MHLLIFFHKLSNSVFNVTSVFLIFTCDRTMKTKLKHHIWNISLFSIFWSAIKCLLAYIPLVLMHLIWGTILSLKTYVNMAYFTCWDYESVTSLQKKQTRNGWNVLSFCYVSKYPGRKNLKWRSTNILKNKFYPLKHL